MINPLKFLSRISLSIVVTLTLSSTTTATEIQSSELTAEIAAMDTKLFDAFNHCDIDTMGQIFGKGLEFYHDQGGLTNYSQTMSSVSQNCERKLGLTRTLVPGSLNVFPVPNFGAIQEGRHQFCHIENGKNDCGTFKFVHVWQKLNDKWELVRVVSYDH